MKKYVLRFILPLSITALLVLTFFKDIRFSDIFSAIARIPLLTLAAFLLLSLAGTLLRTVKYRILIARRISFFDMFLITLVRNFSADLLPARTASLAFYTYLTKRRGLTIEEGGSSFVVSVLYDVLALTLMLGALLLFSRPAEKLHLALWALGLLFLIAAVLIFFAAFFLGRILQIPWLKKFPRILRSLQEIRIYLTEHSTPREQINLTLLSLAVRFIKYYAIFMLFSALMDVPLELKDLPLFSLALAGTEMSSLIPVQGLGGFGTWELAFALIFGGMGLGGGDLKLIAWVIHIFTQTWEYFIGIAAFLFIAAKAKANGVRPEH